MIDDTVLHASEMGIAKQVVELVTVDRTVDEVRERAIVSNQILLAIGPRQQRSLGASGIRSTNQSCDILGIDVIALENVGNSPSIRHR